METARRITRTLSGLAGKDGLVIADDRCVRRIANIESAGVTYNLMHSTYDVDPIIDAPDIYEESGRGRSPLHEPHGIWPALEGRQGQNERDF